MAKIGGPKIVGRAAPILLRWELATFIPAIALAGLWFGTEALLLVSATALGVAWVTRPLPQPARITSYNVCYTKLLRPGSRQGGW